MASIFKNENIIMACFFTGVYDVNGNVTYADDDIDKIKEWMDSIINLRLFGIVFHNAFSDKRVNEFENEYIKFIKVEECKGFYPSAYRYFVYRDFLQKYSSEFSNVFITDILDVVVLKNPFNQELFLSNRNKIFCGDELTTADCEWMRNHNAHLRKKIPDFVYYEDKFRNHTLLNAGIIGGSMILMKSLIEEMASIHEQYNYDNNINYTGDMGVVNYLLRKKYNNRLIHGDPVNTKYKMFEVERKDCWFRHK